jgi:ATP-binding cassette subfamily F protein 3
VLILDEPTNHLDIQSKQVLKQALQKYEGTFLIVSHDREFLDGLTNRIWDIDHGSLKIHHFGVYEYLQRKMEAQQPEKKSGSAKQTAVKAESAPEPAASSEERKEWKRQRNQLSNKIKQLEDQIKNFEAEVEQLNRQMTEIDFSDAEASAPVLKAFEIAKSRLDESTEAWMEASEALETIPAP